MVSMNKNYFLKAHSVHLWQVFVPDWLADIEHFTQLLQPDELQRAKRFHFVEHHDRYIIARAILRQILSLYMQKSAADIVFSYGPRGKPYLHDNPLNIQFNLSHSHDMAVYALTTQHEIGVDIEKIGDRYNPGVATRFFSAAEQEQLNQLPENKRMVAFYRIWAAKEALIKAAGEGLFAPLTEFSIDIDQEKQNIMLNGADYYLKNFHVHEGYQSAFATAQAVEECVYQQWKPGCLP